MGALANTLLDFSIEEILDEQCDFHRARHILWFTFCNYPDQLTEPVDVFLQALVRSLCLIHQVDACMVFGLQTLEVFSQCLLAFFPRKIPW